jgi:acyl carrier protein
MTAEEIRSRVLAVLGNIAPEADLSRLNPQGRLRDQLDIDSMDFLNFMIGLHQDLRVEIPERDYGKLVTLNGCIAYLASILSAPVPDSNQQ